MFKLLLKLWGKFSIESYADFGACKIRRVKMIYTIFPCHTMAIISQGLSPIYTCTDIQAENNFQQSNMYK